MAASEAAADRAWSSSFLFSLNPFGTRLNAHGFETMQVSMDGMSFILGNIFQVGRVAAFDGLSEGFANSKSCMASVVCSPLLLPTFLEQRLKIALINILNNLAGWIKM